MPLGFHLLSDMKKHLQNIGIITNDIIWHIVIIVKKKYDIMSLGDVMQNRLKELRKSRGYTQISLQMQTGIEQALLSKFENGERVPPTETLVRLAEFYNVSIDYILCRTDKPNVNRWSHAGVRAVRLVRGEWRRQRGGKGHPRQLRSRRQPLPGDPQARLKP